MAATMNLGKIGFSAKGNWGPGTYGALETVRHRNSTWAAKRQTVEEPGKGADWMLAVQGKEFLEPGVTVTVGPRGQFATMNAALKHLSETYLPRHDTSGVSAQIRLLTGFEMKEQVFVTNKDLGWITIAGDDQETLIDNDCLTRGIDTVIPSESKWTPAFFGYQATMPVIDQLFRVKNQNTAQDKRRGYVLYASKGELRPGSGFNNVSGVAVCIQMDSFLWAHGPSDKPVQVKNSGFGGIYAWLGSCILASSIDASGSKKSGIVAQYGSSFYANNATAQNCVQTGIYAGEHSVFYGAKCRASNNGDSGVMAHMNSHIIVDDVVADNCKYGVRCIENSCMRAMRASANNCTEAGVTSGDVSRVRADAVSARLCKYGALAYSNSHLFIQDSNLTDCTFRGVESTSGSVVSATNCKATVNEVASSTNASVVNDAWLDFRKSTGGTSQTPNVRTNNGLIIT